MGTCGGEGGGRQRGDGEMGRGTGGGEMERARRESGRAGRVVLWHCTLLSSTNYTLTKKQKGTEQ